MDRTKQQVAVGTVAAVWFFLALLTNQSLSPTPLKLYSIGGATATLLFLAYERYVWRWRIVRRFTKVPLLAGTWRGTINSSYVRPDGTPVPPIAAALRVTQTASTFTATLLTAESSSVSHHSHLTRLPDDRWLLSWLYENAPRPSVRHRSERHSGACELMISGGGGDELSGDYFTDRLTRGELHFSEWSSSTRYASAQTAFAAADFSPATPFVVTKHR